MRSWSGERGADTFDAYERASHILEADTPVSEYPVLKRRRNSRKPTLAELLELESLNLRPGAKEAEIRTRFDLQLARYYQYLNYAIDTPEALEADPVLVNRLIRQRDANLAWRLGRNVSTPTPT